MPKNNDCEVVNDMERLTIKYDGQWVPKELCTIDRNGGADDCVPCNDYCLDTSEGCRTCEECAIQKSFNQLAEYENTGLTPEQIREIDQLYSEKCRELVECQKKQQQGWIPVSERLPAEPDICEVTVKTSNGHLYTDSGYFDECKKEWWKHDDSGLLDVIAWRMRLLEPYKEGKRGSDDRKKPLYRHIKDKV